MSWESWAKQYTAKRNEARKRSDYNITTTYNEAYYPQSGQNSKPRDIYTEKDENEKNLNILMYALADAIENQDKKKYKEIDANTQAEFDEAVKTAQTNLAEATTTNSKKKTNRMNNAMLAGHARLNDINFVSETFRVITGFRTEEDRTHSRERTPLEREEQILKYDLVDAIKANDDDDIKDTIIEQLENNKKKQNAAKNAARNKQAQNEATKIAQKKEQNANKNNIKQKLSKALINFENNADRMNRFIHYVNYIKRWIDEVLKRIKDTKTADTTIKEFQDLILDLKEQLEKQLDKFQDFIEKYNDNYSQISEKYQLIDFKINQEKINTLYADYENLFKTYAKYTDDFYNLILNNFRPILEESEKRGSYLKENYNSIYRILHIDNYNNKLSFFDIKTKRSLFSTKTEATEIIEGFSNIIKDYGLAQAPAKGGRRKTKTRKLARKNRKTIRRVNKVLF